MAKPRRVRIVNNLPEFVATTQQRAVRNLTSVLVRIGSEVAPLVPIETSTLINSQYRHIDMQGSALVGRIGFTAEYALAVHEAAGKWRGLGIPRPRVNGKDRGYYWGPNDGQPQFLAVAGERAASDVASIIKRGMRV
ncbi:hypothetical protein [Aquabacterium sp. OR-4]|uniref:hypothetical protein n=1 Tax=Aquabacterium sp. OR-4 TaxID=2978127 RepID=UPI0021B4D367|nr:hypothetical protein [Aquabacterium sp. OR-4]MDT7834960.1 hypothetical protein [Aquabacterium sp. OR-4]